MYRQAAWEQIESELSNAEAARSQGLEGRARVCARRAAGIAIREYLHQNGMSAPAGSAYDLLRVVQELPGVSTAVKRSAERLRARVNEDYSLPAEIDLLVEARDLIKALEPEDKQ